MTNTGLVVAVVASVAIGAQSIRVLLALLYSMRETEGVLPALGIALVVFGSPVFAAPIRRVLGGRWALVAVLGCLAISALVMQLHHPIGMGIATTTTALGILAWTLTMHASRAPRAEGGVVFAVGFVGGFIVDTSVHAAFGTWDPMWRSGVLAPATTMIMLAALALPITQAVRTDAHDGSERGLPGLLPVATLGPLLVLQVLVLLNVGWVSASAGVAPATAATAIVLGQSCALLVMIRSSGRRPSRVTLGWAGAAVASVCLTVIARGPWVLVLVAVAGIFSDLCLWTAVASGRGRSHRSAWRTSVVVAFGMVAFAALTVAYHIDVVRPLPVSPTAIPIACSIVLAGAAVLGARSASTQGTELRDLGPRMRFGATAGVLAALALVLGTGAVGSSDTDGDALGPSGRILSWNVHAALNGQGQIDPSAIADTIEGHRADVVVLQEVGRGWPIAGSLDLASWLSDRLDMRFAWAPAADERFGNLVLSRPSILDAEGVALPYGDGPQRRSAVVATIAGDGIDVTVVGTHLESGSPGTRTFQIRSALARIDGASCAVVAGDMNMQPSDAADVARFADAGLRSALDAVGRSTATTARDPAFPGDRPDWIFVSRDVPLVDAGVGRSGASDHLPIIVTIGSCARPR